VDTVEQTLGEGIAPLNRPATPPTRTQGGLSAHGEDAAATTEVAKQQAADVADSATRAGAQVADTAKEQAGQVSAEVKHQAQQLLVQAQSELTEQATATQQRVSEGLHALAEELSGMARNSEQDGVATDLARQAADKAREAAGWLADREPGSLLDEVRSFARRKPGTYLAIALGAGVLAGRLTRGLTAPTENNTRTSTAPVTPATSAYPVGRGQDALTGGETPVAPVGYDPRPVTGPGVPLRPPVTDAIVTTNPPVTGNGGTGTLGGPRDVVAP
jgi:hypothetical protein